MVVGACIDESGADGMFSPIRRALLPHLDASGQGFKKLPLTTLNLRATSPEVRQWVKDENGMNLIYGSGWVAAFIPLKPLSHASEQEDSAEKISNSVYVALTLSHYLVADGLLPTMTDHPSKFFRTLVADPGRNTPRRIHSIRPAVPLSVGIVLCWLETRVMGWYPSAEPVLRQESKTPSTSSIPSVSLPTISPIQLMVISE